jgi:isoleucyl-tRNA synthetase
LTTVTKLLAPVIPFITEEIYRNLTGEESVHLTDWPSFASSSDKAPADKKASAGKAPLVEQMKQVRKIVELGLAQRKEKQLKVKQPLAKITVYQGEEETQFSEALEQLILDELNVKKVEFAKKTVSETSVELETALTDDLVAEGQAREIVRKIQEERKKLGTSLDEKVDVQIETWPEAHAAYIKRNALVNALSKGEFQVKRL